MLALTQAQGIILAIGGAVFLAIAGSVLFLRGRRRAAAPDIPQSMRPGPSDEDLETPLLQKLQGWGVLLVVFLVVWVPATWLLEPGTNLAQERDLKTDAIHRGSLAVELFTEENQCGLGCGVPRLDARMRTILNRNRQPDDVQITPNLDDRLRAHSRTPRVYSLKAKKKQD